MTELEIEILPEVFFNEHIRHFFMIILSDNIFRQF